MPGGSMTLEHSRCRKCGFEAPGGADEWQRIDIPKLGRMTQCPECGSTDVMTRRVATSE